mmetsp:Transcript_24995/g.80540  ORF Transcript_24995/g.80540 Transcript_24995/m.80540 type:complete len:610 (-) Transcript_24995:461-2290(-)
MAVQHLLGSTAALLSPPQCPCQRLRHRPLPRAPLRVLLSTAGQQWMDMAMRMHLLLQQACMSPPAPSLRLPPTRASCPDRRPFLDPCPHITLRRHPQRRRRWQRRRQNSQRRQQRRPRRPRSRPTRRLRRMRAWPPQARRPAIPALALSLLAPSTLSHTLLAASPPHLATRTGVASCPAARRQAQRWQRRPPRASCTWPSPHLLRAARSCRPWTLSATGVASWTATRGRSVGVARSAVRACVCVCSLGPECGDEARAQVGQVVVRSPANPERPGTQRRPATQPLPHPTISTASVALGLDILVVQEHKAEHEEAAHHGQGARVVRERGRDEALILVVAEGPHRDLIAQEQSRVARPPVHDAELVDAIHIGHLEHGGEAATVVVLEGGAHVGVQHDELHLHVVRGVRLPLLPVPLLDCHCVLHVVLDPVHQRVPRDLRLRVQRRGQVLPLLVLQLPLRVPPVGPLVRHVTRAEHAPLAKRPLAQLLRQLAVGRARGHRRVGARRLHRSLEQRVRQQVQRARDQHARVVARLHRGHQQHVGAGRLRVVPDGLVGVRRVGGGARGQHPHGEDVLLAHGKAHALEQHGSARRLEGAHDQRHLGHVGREDQRVVV